MGLCNAFQQAVERRNIPTWAGAAWAASCVFSGLFQYLWDSQVKSEIINRKLSVIRRLPCAPCGTSSDPVFRGLWALVCGASSVSRRLWSAQNCFCPLPSDLCSLRSPLFDCGQRSAWFQRKAYLSNPSNPDGFPLKCRAFQQR